MFKELKRVGGRGMSNEIKWLEIKKEYLRKKVDGEKFTLTELAKKHGVKPSTLRSRKNREKWDGFLENVATQIENNSNTVATDKDDKPNDGHKNTDNETAKPETDTKIAEMDTKTKKKIRRSIAQLGNKNAIGNKGGPGAQKGNKLAEKHGFYAKHLPGVTLELFEEIEEMDQLDLLWDSIKLKYAAIIRAQSIMFVEDQDDITAHLKKHKVIKGLSYTEEKEWEIQFPWDKYATFLQAQSRAMAELRSLIKQYNDIVDRGMATQEQKLRIEKLQLEIDKMAGDDTGQETEEWVKAIEEIAAKRRGKNE